MRIIIMKFLTLPAVGALFVFAIFMLATADVDAQNNWVRCKYTLDGTIQSFPGTQCPLSWYPV